MAKVRFNRSKLYWQTRWTEMGTREDFWKTHVASLPWNIPILFHLSTTKSWAESIVKCKWCLLVQLSYHLLHSPSRHNFPVFKRYTNRMLNKLNAAASGCVYVTQIIEPKFEVPLRSGSTPAPLCFCNRGDRPTSGRDPGCWDGFSLAAWAGEEWGGSVWPAVRGAGEPDRGAS